MTKRKGRKSVSHGEFDSIEVAMNRSQVDDGSEGINTK